MKKVGLCVCHDTRNYGSQLQVLATEVFVGKLGYEYEIIRYKKKYDAKMVLKSIPRLFNPILMEGKISGIKKIAHLKKYPDIYRKCQARKKVFDNFAGEYFSNLSPVYYGYDALKKGSDSYDAFVVGSDQLWLPSGLASGFYTLEFVKDNKLKIAYATSFGVSEIPFYQKRRTERFLKRFDYLSSRELKGVEIIKTVAGLDAEVVVDPTLLLTPEDWIEVIENKRLVNEPYIFCYFLGTNQEHRRAAIELKKQTGLKIVTLPFLDDFTEADLEFGDIQLFDASSADFVNLIRNAEYVLTDSFHGSVFSILNKKKFCTFNRFNDGTSSRNSRIDSLCSQLKLEDRRYKGDVSIVKNEIEYSLVYTRLNELRAASIAYLSGALEAQK